MKITVLFVLTIFRDIASFSHLLDLLPCLLGRGDGFGLEHDGALRFVDQAKLTQPKLHWVQVAAAKTNKNKL